MPFTMDMLKIAYTRSVLKDKLYEKIDAARHHYYLLSLLSKTDFLRFRDHWSEEYLDYVAAAQRVLRHPATIKPAGKYKAYQEVKNQLMDQAKENSARQQARQHFTKTFGQDRNWRVRAHDTVVFWQEMDQFVEIALLADSWKHEKITI